jgi:hypothetical protein
MMKYDALIHCHFDTQQSKKKYQYSLEYLLLDKKMILLIIILFSAHAHIFTLGQDAPDFKKVGHLVGTCHQNLAIILCWGKLPTSGSYSPSCQGTSTTWELPTRPPFYN